jgi:hypothetical protein
VAAKKQNTNIDLNGNSILNASWSQGDVMYVSSAGVLTRLAASTKGYVLATQGASQNPAWVGAPVLLDTKVASNSATIDFTSYIDSTYKLYTVEWDGVKSGSTGNGLQMRISTDGGSTWKAGASDYAYSIAYWSTAGSTVTVQQSTGVASMNCAVAVITTTANTSGSGTVKCFNPSDTARFFSIETSSVVTNTSTLIYTHRGCGNYTTAGAVNGFRFLMQSGNIVSGTFRLYGVP